MKSGICGATPPIPPPMEDKKAQLHWTCQGRFATKSSTKIQKIHQKYQNNKGAAFGGAPRGARFARPPWDLLFLNSGGFSVFLWMILWQISPEMSNAVVPFYFPSGVIKNCQKLSKIVKNCQYLAMFLHLFQILFENRVFHCLEIILRCLVAQMSWLGSQEALMATSFFSVVHR